MSVRLKNGSWIVEVYDPTKKRKRHVTKREIAELGLAYPLSEKQALKVERRVLIALDEREEGAPTEVTCREFAENWTRDYPRPDESSNKTNHERVSKFGKDFGDRLLASVRRQEARQWALENVGRIPAVRAMFNDAVNDEIVPKNPFAGLRIVKAESRKERGQKRSPVTRDELHEMADLALVVHGEAMGPMVRALILVAAYTGMRAGELFGLRWSDIEGDTIRVQRQFSSRLGREKEPKAGSMGAIFCPEPAREALRTLPRRLDTELVFTTERGRQFTQGNLQHYWPPVRSAFGKHGLAFHSLRHFCATYLLNELRVEPWKVAKQLRHSDGGTLVLNTYGHPSEGVALEDIRRAWGANVTPLRSVDVEAESA